MMSSSIGFFLIQEIQHWEITPSSASDRHRAGGTPSLSMSHKGYQCLGGGGLRAIKISLSTLSRSQGKRAGDHLLTSHLFISGAYSVCFLPVSYIDCPSISFYLFLFKFKNDQKYATITFLFRLVSRVLDAVLVNIEFTHSRMLNLVLRINI